MAFKRGTESSSSAAGSAGSAGYDVGADSGSDLAPNTSGVHLIRFWRDETGAIVSRTVPIVAWHVGRHGVTSVTIDGQVGGPTGVSVYHEPGGFYLYGPHFALATGDWLELLAWVETQLPVGH